ncbi:hypothetical protein [Mahella australiensis]|jgi:hypothetical protein|uniref:Uncharacterized protein n=1 Tax=Mahella australiensis (strain DSM 15567 / CIP 107919 / 50-1 BON) TaxID=697281 RepID=F3ZZH9_MAHA5|nr:hypothetical protein [Mahella australiensis]AEE96805.1 hypothetical protein Mahau_1622 [Mahella australiensis 50-1 BON]
MSGIIFNANVSTNQISANPIDTRRKGNEDVLNSGYHDEVFISDESRKLFQVLKEYEFDGPLKLDKQFLQRDYYEQRKLEFAKSLSERQDIAPLENEFQILGVSYVFKPGSLEQFISEKLEGKAENPSLLASEIAENIRGTVSNPNATIDERAVNRKTALRLAEEIARNYFDNVDEAKDFLSVINEYAENDVLREKGYVVFDNSDMKPFKEYTLPTAPENYICGSAFAEKYGYTNLKEIFDDSAKYEGFINALQKNGEKWKEDIVRSFDEHEQLVQKIIDESSLSQLNEQYIQDIISTFFNNNN